MPAVKLERCNGYWLGSFQAMASPCELLMALDSDQRLLAAELLQIAFQEARRIERAFSRYRHDNLIAAINGSQGKAVEVDDETCRLLNFADDFYQLSDGLFDITAGVFRRIWRFDGRHTLPSASEVKQLLPLVGWHRVEWEPPYIRLPVGMEIDLGGVGKEYAVDYVALLIAQLTDASVLVNFGGDLVLTAPQPNGEPWRVARYARNGQPRVLSLHSGALATSGDTHRYLLKDGVRYSHIINPKSGWAVSDAPGSITVAAPSCIEAGMLSTLALLHGREAEQFLQAQEVEYWLD